MGAQVGQRLPAPRLHRSSIRMAPRAMKTAMKAAMKAGAAMSKSGIAAALATATEQKPAVCKKMLETLAEVATKEVKSTGKFTIPGLCMLKTRVRPATKVVKACCVSALKKSI